MSEQKELDELSQMISKMRAQVEYLLAGLIWIYKEDKDGLIGAKAKTLVEKIIPNHEDFRD